MYVGTTEPCQSTDREHVLARFRINLTKAPDRCHACLRLGLTCQQSDSFRTVHVVENAGVPRGKRPIQLCHQPRPREKSPASGTRTGEHPLSTGYLSVQDLVDTEQLNMLADDDVVEDFSPYTRSESPTTQKLEMVPTTPSSLSHTPEIPHDDWHHLQYYVERQSNLILNAYTLRNPLRSVVLPRIMASPVLRHAVCSIAAQHRANQTHGDKDALQVAATSYYVRALSKVKESIASISTLPGLLDCWDAGAVEDTVLASIFLCMHEITKSGVENWRQHLVGIESLWPLLMQRRAGEMSEAIMFVQSLYVRVKQPIPQITMRELTHLTA